MIGSLRYARTRTPAGKLTNFKTGDRFVDMVIPKEPLPKNVSGDFYCIFVPQGTETDYR